MLRVLAQIRHPVALHVIDLVRFSGMVVLQHGLRVAIAEFVRSVIKIGVLLFKDILIVLHRGWGRVVNSHICTIHGDVPIRADVFCQELTR